jgi:hypothetical protein
VTLPALWSGSAQRPKTFKFRQCNGRKLSSFGNADVVGIPCPIDSRPRTRRADRKAGVEGRAFVSRNRGEKGGHIVVPERNVRG